MATTSKTAASSSRERKSKGKTEISHEQIAALAYMKAEARGFAPGHEMDDWLEAEREVNGSASKRKP